jgi:hypothetical protein
MTDNPTEDYKRRLKRINDAIALKEPDKLPVAPYVDGLPYFLYPELGVTHKTALYDIEKATEAQIRYHLEFTPDANTTNMMALSGRAADFLQPTMMDWPGRAGTTLSDMSIYQMHEIEYLKADEYDEFLNDYSGFILHKYLPRSYKGLKGLSEFRIDPSCCILDRPLHAFADPELREALGALIAYGEESEKVNTRFKAFLDKMSALGFPPLFTVDGQVPFDILSDYFRGMLGTLYDQAERPDKIRAACEKFKEIEIEVLKSQLGPDSRVRRVFFPMHKGMDSFISDAQYRELYWEPYQEVLRTLIEMNVTPIIYTEGSYATRYAYIRERLLEFPPGSCMIHFEIGDFAELKRMFKGVACLFGGMPLQLLEFGTPEEVRDRVRYLAESCGAGGGFILGTSASIENAKRENIEAMFEAARKY